MGTEYDRQSLVFILRQRKYQRTVRKDKGSLKRTEMITSIIINDYFLNDCYASFYLLS